MQTSVKGSVKYCSCRFNLPRWGTRILNVTINQALKSAPIKSQLGE